MKHESRTEAGNARAPCMTHAGENDAVRSGIKQRVGQRLWRTIALGNRAGLKAALPLRVIKEMKLRGEIGQELRIIEAEQLGDSGIFQEAALVKRHLLDRGIDDNAGIPAAAP